MCSGSEVGSYLRLIDSCITQLKAHGPSRTCNESKEEEEGQGVGFSTFVALASGEEGPLVGQPRVRRQLSREVQRLRLIAPAKRKKACFHARKTLKSVFSRQQHLRNCGEEGPLIGQPRVRWKLSREV